LTRSAAPVAIAIDPGKTTGFAVVERDDWDFTRSGLILRHSSELDESLIIPALRVYLDSFSDKQCAIIIETFVINAQTVKNSAAPWSLKVTGAVEQVCRDYGYPVESIEWQAPANAKSVVPNEKLKRLELWHRGGAGHANDAIRHAVLYFIRHGYTSPLLLKDG
jgi:hypothetical protein